MGGQRTNANDAAATSGADGAPEGILLWGDGCPMRGALKTVGGAARTVGGSNGTIAHPSQQCTYCTLAATSVPSFAPFEPMSELWKDYQARFDTFAGANSIPDRKMGQVFLTNQTAAT